MDRIITMNDFLTNPTGKSSASFARRDLVIANLGYRFNELVNKVPITHKVYKYKNSYIMHIKIPSEKYLEKLIYDIVLQFIIPDESKSTTINDYEMKMYSNSPNFMFTYAYVYNQDDNLIEFLKSKLNKKSLTDEPKVKNPQFTYGFEKSVYFALLHIKKSKLNYKSNLINVPELKNLNAFLMNIKSSDFILDEIENIKNKLRIEKKAKKENKKEIYKKRTTKKLKDSSTNKISNNRKTSSFKTVKAKKSLDTHKSRNKTIKKK